MKILPIWEEILIFKNALHGKRQLNYKSIERTYKFTKIARGGGWLVARRGNFVASRENN